MKSNTEMPKASLSDSLRVLKDGENSNLSPQSFGLLALVALIVISIFRSRIVESIILGLAVMDEYKFVNPSAPPTYVKAYSIPPAYPGSN